MAALITGDTARSQAQMISIVAAMDTTKPSWGALGAVFLGDLQPHSFLPEFACGHIASFEPLADDNSLLRFGDSVPWFWFNDSSFARRFGSNIPWKVQQKGPAMDSDSRLWEVVAPSTDGNAKAEAQMLKLILGETQQRESLLSISLNNDDIE